MSVFFNGFSVAPSVTNMHDTEFKKVTARPEFVVKGKTFYDETGQLLEGTLVNYGTADVYICFSEHADGTDFSAEWSEGKNYIGYALAKSAPTSKSAFTWHKFIS